MSQSHGEIANPPRHSSLSSIIQATKRRPPSRHLGSIDALIQLFKMTNVEVEKISPVIGGQRLPPGLTTEVAASREASISNEKRDAADYKIFTDGSDHNRGVGASAVLIAKDWPRPLLHLKAYLGTSKKIGNYEAKLAGGILAMKLIEGIADAGNLTFSVFTDNQAFVQEVARPSAAPGQHLLQEFLRAV